MKILSWSKHFWVGMVENECDQSSHGTVELVVLQEEIDGINWYFACC